MAVPKTWQRMQRLPEDAQGDEVASEEKTTQPEHRTIKQRETSIYRSVFTTLPDDYDVVNEYV